MITFTPKLHAQHFNAFLKYHMPAESVDSIRATVGYFAISGLDVLGKIETVTEKSKAYIDWIYYLFCPQTEVAGFQNFATFNNIKAYWSGHLAATYSALNTLLILGDDLSRLNKDAIIKSLKLLQLDDGSYMASKTGTENDMRFVYCAASISYILDDFSGMDIPRVLDFIIKSISYDGGIGQGPDLESHGGSTYCAIATLALTDNLHKLSAAQMHNLTRWLLRLQLSGFMGRPNKEQDTCYTFWVGATLKILGHHNLINRNLLKNFVLSSQDFREGGFSKYPEYVSDPLHTYFSLAGLSLMNFDKLNVIVPSLNMTQRAHEHLQSLHKQWRDNKIAP